MTKLPASFMPRADESKAKAPVGLGGLIERCEAACLRAESEYPHLAAPDGTVAIPFADLRLLLILVERLGSR